MTLPPYTRDDARYWDRKPDDHNASGFFVFGPQPATPPLPKLIAPAICPVSAPSPAVARAQMRIKRNRVKRQATGLQKLLAQLEGRHTRNRRAA